LKFLRIVAYSLLTILIAYSAGHVHASLPSQIEHTTFIALSQPLTVRWFYSSDLTLNLTPAANGDRIYLPLASGNLVSLRATDGQLYWKADLGGEISASPTADERAVFIATQSVGTKVTEPRSTGAIRALGREGGVTLWVRNLRRPLRGALVANQTTLFGGSSDGRVFALNKRTGQFTWVTQHWAGFTSHPVLSGSKLYIGSDDGTVFALDQAKGIILWRYQTHGAVRGRPVAAGGLVYFGSADGYVYAVNEADGRLRWSTRTGASVQAVAQAGDGLLVASLDNFVYYLSLNGGDRLWKRQLAGRLTSEPLTANDGALFVPMSGDAGVVLDYRDGKQLNNLPLGEDNNTAASPVATGNVLLITTRRGLMAFSSPTVSTQSKGR
jgi:outer membrane protein assembly factor BamB